jgi:hypothetical protein
VTTLQTNQDEVHELGTWIGRQQAFAALTGCWRSPARAGTICAAAGV